MVESTRCGKKRAAIEVLQWHGAGRCEDLRAEVAGGKVIP
jgi:hypothetical protein